jgi:hypothetical protein
MLAEFDDSSCVAGAASCAASCEVVSSIAANSIDGLGGSADAAAGLMIDSPDPPEVREDEEAMDDAEHQGEASLVLQPRHGVVARATAWLLDSVFGPAAPFINRLDGLQTRVSGVSIWEIREAGWLQPLMGSRLEARMLYFMSQIHEVVDIAKQHAKQQRCRSRTVGWRQMLLDATAEVQSMCTYANIKSGVRMVASSDMALSALDNRWIQKVVNSRLVPQQVKHWGNFVLSPGTLETIDENSPMPVRQMQRGSEHWPADTVSVTASDETVCTEADLERSSEEKGEGSPSMRRNSSQDADLCALALH